MVDLFFSLRNCTYFCDCGWGPSEFKNLYGVAHYSQYKTSKWHEHVLLMILQESFFYY